MRIYRLVFLKKAAKEWNKLGATVRSQFEKKLAERLRSPRVPKDQLSNLPGCYKVKLQKAGDRLIYRVDDKRVVVMVIKIGQREGGEAYDKLDERLAEDE